MIVDGRLTWTIGYTAARALLALLASEDRVGGGMTEVGSNPARRQRTDV